MDHKKELVDLLNAYEPADEGELGAKKAIIGFIAKNKDIGRENPAGHITGSAFVVDGALTRVLLNHHAKLDRWLQFGGHMEAGEGIMETALREASEESGLEVLFPLMPGVFDLDVHLIPERGETAAHYHYDLRFLLRADPAETLRLSSESKSVKWAALGEMEDYTDSESMLRMKRKVEAMCGAAASRLA